MASRFLSRVWERSPIFTFRAAKKTMEFSNAMLFSTESTRPAKDKISGKLFYKILLPLKSPDISATPVLDQWVKEEGEFLQRDIREIIQFLRARHRFSQALEVSEWMSTKGIGKTSASDHAIRLDLIGKVRGLESAESYFNSLDPKDQTKSTYGALFVCYVRKGNVDKSLSLFEKMKDMGLPLSPLDFSHLMFLYGKSGQLKKIPTVFSEMREKGIIPDSFSYRNLLLTYGKWSEFESVEKILQEMESQSFIIMDWLTYSVVANIYIKAGIKEKALIYLKKCEENVGKNAVGYRHLISLYTNLGEKDEIWRLWILQKIMCKKQNNSDYIVMLGSLVKLGELDAAKILFDEWESSCQTYDFRVPNVLLIGYCQNGFVEMAEKMLKNISNKCKKTIPNSWSIVTAGYIKKQDMKKAFQCFRKALALPNERERWRPKPDIVFAILKWLGDHGHIEEVENFVKKLEDKYVTRYEDMAKVKREMHCALLKAYIRCGKDSDELLERIKSDGLENNEEIEKILSSR